MQFYTKEAFFFPTFPTKPTKIVKHYFSNIYVI